MSEKITLAGWHQKLFTLAQTVDFSAFCDAVNQFGKNIENNDIIPSPVFAVGDRVMVSSPILSERHHGKIYVIENVIVNNSFCASYTVLSHENRQMVFGENEITIVNEGI